MINEILRTTMESWRRPIASQRPPGHFDGTEAKTTSTTAEQPAISASDMIDKMRQAMDRIERISSGNSLPLGGIAVRESTHCTRQAPARPHKRRRNQSEAYHRRIQKKWIKRWGMTPAPVAYLIDNRLIGGAGKTLVIHPTLRRKLAHHTIEDLAHANS